ncbi:site-specific integrase [Streptomyces chartreusis]|uniref:site-specific integrase n=1 Tax=Streptomyces chartreusis TaxID=1969 RepID=UPI003D8A5D37
MGDLEASGRHGSCARTDSRRPSESHHHPARPELPTCPEESTIQGYRNVLCHVREHLGHIKVQELTGTHVKEFITWLLTSARRRGGTAGTGLRPSTVDGVLCRLRSVLRLAVEEGIVTRSVAESEFIRAPKTARKQDKRTHARPKPWAVAEVREFLVGVRDDRLFAPLLLGLMGLRPAEVAGLRWEDIDFDAGTLTVAETRTMVGNKGWWPRTPRPKRVSGRFRFPVRCSSRC